MSRTVSAVPEELLKYSHRATQIDVRLDNVVAAIDSNAGNFLATRPDFVGDLPDRVYWLRLKLRALANQCKEVDTVVGRVGLAFANAGGRLDGHVTVPEGLLESCMALPPLPPGLLNILSNKALSPAERARQVREWAATRTKDELMALAAVWPREFGNMDGIPLNVRYHANRIAIEQRLPYETNEERRRVLEDIVRNPQRQILLFDPHGDGRIAEVFGNIETADNVAISVPGISTSLDNFDNFRRDALGLHQAAGSRTATIAWLGYDTPKGLEDPLRMVKEATSAQQGLAGATALASTIGGLGLRADQRLTVIGHSYGSVVVALAAREGGLADADAVVFIGSPGVVASSAQELGLSPGTELYAASTPDDPVPASGPVLYGPDPTSPGFGAWPFPTERYYDDLSDFYNPLSPHSQYYMRQNLSELSHIVTTPEPRARVVGGAGGGGSW